MTEPATHILGVAASKSPARRGIGGIDGEMPQENVPMLKMRRELGFTITAQPAGVTTVSKRLKGD
jgi:hypothetical protein